jgi:glycerophosphoryl diester phosphodiesterase
MGFGGFAQPATLVGHRGLGAGTVGGHDQNTLASFLAALDAGIGWVEVDVGMTGDGQLFVAHDAYVKAAFLSQVTGEQASRWGLLRIDELLEALPADAGVVFDVKSALEDAGRSPTSTTAAVLARGLRRAVQQRPVIALSFDPASLHHMRAETPGLPLGLLTWTHFPVGHAVAAAAHLDVQLLALHAGSLWPSDETAPEDIPALAAVVAAVHRADRQLLAWCPTPEQALALAAANVDALVVDDVAHQVDALRSLV